MKSIARSRIVIVIALFYAIIYSLASIWYLQLTLDPNRSISLMVQVTTLFLALSGIVYFIWPLLGHPLMLLSTVIVCLCAKSMGDTGDVWFFGIIAIVLVWNLVCNIHKLRVNDNIEVHQTPLCVSNDFVVREQISYRMSMDCGQRSVILTLRDVRRLIRKPYIHCQMKKLK